jgi:uncharacterized membrane protein HdeD (DUF308 family)
MLKTIGIILVVVGILALVVPSISFTQKEKVLDIGPIEATKTETKRIPVAPIVGISALIVGAALLVVGATKKA